MNKCSINTHFLGKIQTKNALNFKGNEQEKNTMESTISKLKELLETHSVTEFGHFDPARVAFENNDDEYPNVGEVVLSIEQSDLEERPYERIIRIKAFSKDKEKSYSIVLKRGTKSELQTYLKDENTITTSIKDHISNAHERFIDPPPYW